MSSPERSAESIPNEEIAVRYRGRELDATAIQELLPHRPPFLLVDRVIELDPCVRAVGLKAVTINEWFFQGHFPGHPVMPGVLIIEALAQLGGVMLLTGLERQGRQNYFSSIKEAKFRRLVVPGDLLRLEATVQRATSRFRRLVCMMHARATVDGELAAEATCSFALVPSE